MIGPCGCGKSTLAKLLAEQLRIPNRSLDKLCWDYYKEIGYCPTSQKQTADQDGLPGAYGYLKPFEAHAVERLLAGHPTSVKDFGAGHSVYEDAVLFDRVSKLLVPYKNIVLVLPSNDLDAAVQILRERTLKEKNWDCVLNGFDFHQHFVRHHSNRTLAKFTVYTAGKSPEQTRDEILAMTGLQLL